MTIFGRHQSKLSVHTNDDWAVFDPEENGSILGKTQRDRVLKVFEPNQLEETYHDTASNDPTTSSDKKSQKKSETTGSMYYLGQARPQTAERQPPPKNSTSAASSLVYSLFSTPSIPEDDSTAPLNLTTSSLLRTSTGEGALAKNGPQNNHHGSTDHQSPEEQGSFSMNKNITNLLNMDTTTKKRNTMSNDRETSKTSTRQFYSISPTPVSPGPVHVYEDDEEPELELAHRRSEESDHPGGRNSALQFLVSYQNGLSGNDGLNNHIESLRSQNNASPTQQTLVSSLSSIQDSQFKEDGDDELDQEVIRKILQEDESVSTASKQRTTRVMTPAEEVANKMKQGPAAGDIEDKDDDDSSSHTFRELQQPAFHRNAPSPSSLMLRRNYTTSPSTMRRNAPSPSMSLASHTKKKGGASFILAAMTGKNRRNRKTATSEASSSKRSDVSLRKLVFPKRLFQKRSNGQPVKRLAASPLTLDKNVNTESYVEENDLQEREQLWKQKIKQRMAAKEEERLSAAIERDGRASTPVRKRNATPTTFVFEDNLPSGKRTIKSISPMNQGDDMSSLTSPPERMEEHIQRFTALEPGDFEEEREPEKPRKNQTQKAKPTSVKDAWKTALTATLKALVNVAETIDQKVDDASSAAYTASTQSSGSQTSIGYDKRSSRGLSACFICTAMAERCSSPEDDDEDYSLSQ